ncbi:MAG TPA: aquaporin [Dehalococcoidia bacterium]|nr:aquaporin [Dehalococcoidia bacterium]
MASQRNMNLGAEELTSPDALRAAFAELIATGLFVLVGLGSIAAFIAASGGEATLADGLPTIALGHGLAFGLLVASTAAISGGHLNPAVTFATVITGQISVVRGAMYVVAQLLGACLGTLAVRAFVEDIVLRNVPGGGGSAITRDVVGAPWHGLLLEALGTFLLVWTIFAVVIHPRNNAGRLAPLYVGLSLTVIYFFLFPFTGSGVNPARTFGPALLLPGPVEGLPGRWEDFWVYYLGPLIGAGVAGLLFYLIYLTPERSRTA